MSWLYTVLFTGLVFSSQPPESANVQNAHVQLTAAAVVQAADELEKFDQTYPLNPGGKVSVSNVNGSIVVEAWDRNEVRLEYTKVGDSRERLGEVQVRIDSRPDSLSVQTDYDEWKNNRDRQKMSGKLNVEYKLTVPRGAILNEIEAVNGSVTVSNFTNITKVSAVNGTVTAINLRGTAKLSTVNGSVKADFDRLDPGARISLETVNGPVSLTIPSDSNATLRADSLNGQINNDFGLPVRKGEYIGRDLYGRVGSGDTQIKLNSVNGGLTIARKGDGKGLSPATNLLNQVDKDNDKWEKELDRDLSQNSRTINKQVEKSVKESVKASAKAMKDVNVQLANLEPEISRVTESSVRNVLESINTEQLTEKIKAIDNAKLATLDRVSDAMFTPGLRRVEKKSGTFGIKGVAKVTISAKGCSVSVRGWDKSEVQYRITQLPGRASQSPLKVNETINDSVVNLSVEDPDASAPGFFSADQNRSRIEVFVPRKSNVKITADGEIRVEGVSGELDLKGSDESINVRDADGKLRVANADGKVRVIGFRGELDAVTTDGSLSLEGDFTKLTARGEDGDITLTLPENASADLEASGEDIEGEGVSLNANGAAGVLNKYKIGKGGPSYKIQTDGQIRIRSSATLRELN